MESITAWNTILNSDFYKLLRELCYGEREERKLSLLSGKGKYISMTEDC